MFLSVASQHIGNLTARHSMSCTEHDVHQHVQALAEPLSTHVRHSTCSMITLSQHELVASLKLAESRQRTSPVAAHRHNTAETGVCCQGHALQALVHSRAASTHPAHTRTGATVLAVHYAWQQHLPMPLWLTTSSEPMLMRGRGHSEVAKCTE